MMSISPKILIVEDDSDFRQFLVKLLNLKDYETLTAGNGYEALNYLNDNAVDLILLDICLPDMDGYWIMDRIKTKFPDRPVIMMTGSASVDSAVKALKKGAYDYLEKPFATEKLLKTIENALEHKRLEAQRTQALIKLGVSEEKYHQLFDSVSDALFILDAETLKFEDANKAALNLFGYSIEEICNHKVDDLSAEKEETRTNLEKVRKGAQGSRLVPHRLLQKKDGTNFYGEISVASFNSGGHKKIIGAIRDITERQQAQEELNKAKKRLQHLLTSSPVIIYAHDPGDYSTTFISDNIKIELGYEPGEFIENSGFWLSRIHPEDAKLAKLEISKLFEHGSRVYEYRFQCKDGSYRWMRDESRVSYNDKGQPKEVIGSWIDVTDEKRTEQKLRESEARFRNLVENSLVGITIIQDHKFVYQNQVQDKLFGSMADITVYQILKYIHPNDVDKIKVAYESVRCGDVQVAEEDFRFYSSGKIGRKSDMRWVQCRATAFTFQGKEAILVNAIDITDAKQLEHQLIIKNKMLSLGRVAAGIAHEIRNPLTGINSYLFTLEDLCRSETIEAEDIHMIQQIIEQLQVASNKIESVIKRVMDFSKPGAPKMVLTDINESLEEAIKLSSVSLRKNGIKLEKSLTHKLPRCYVDPQLIEQVILNLINNAARALENGNGKKLIEVKSFSKNNKLCIGVSDSGPGVSFKLREKIFDPFFTTKEDGHGIGLNIAQRIVADHYGSLSLDTSK
jgi:PAS domain S-box-containing protein